MSKSRLERGCAAPSTRQRRSIGELSVCAAISRLPTKCVSPYRLPPNKVCVPLSLAPIACLPTKCVSPYRLPLSLPFDYACVPLFLIGPVSISKPGGDKGIGDTGIFPPTRDPNAASPHVPKRRFAPQTTRASAATREPRSPPAPSTLVRVTAYMTPMHSFTRCLMALLVVLSGILVAASASSAAPTFAERLGWKPGSVVVVLHVDDVGMSHSSNLGAVESMEQGVASSCAVMMPCAWVSEFAAYLKLHPTVDSGLHLTLTSEWVPYRWGPVAGKSQVPGLVDPEGCLWRNVAGVVAKASPDEIEREIRAQVERAETMGIPITHLDSHMGTLFARADYFERFARVGLEKKIPILAVGGHGTYTKQENPTATDELRGWIPKLWNAGLPILDDLHTGSYGWKPSEKTERLLALLKELKPGVTEILFHASRPTEDFPVITGSSESRRADLGALTEPKVKALLQERGIEVTTWRELKRRREHAAPLE